MMEVDAETMNSYKPLELNRKMSPIRNHQLRTSYGTRYVADTNTLEQMLDHTYKTKSFECWFDNQVSLKKSTEDKLYQLAMDLYNSSHEKLYSSKYWGQYGSFSSIGVEVMGSLSYGMMLADSSDLDIAFVFSYNNGGTMSEIDPVKLKIDAIKVFKEIFGSKYTYTMKITAINLSNDTEDIDILFYNVVNKSTVSCSADKRCVVELNYGKCFDGPLGYWHNSEILSLTSELDKVFSKNTEKRAIINRTGRMFKAWRRKVFSDQETKIPSVAMVTMIYDFCKEKGNSYTYETATHTLRDVIDYSMIKYFKNDKFEGLNLPVYHKGRNLLEKLDLFQCKYFVTKLADFHEVLMTATSKEISEAELVKLFEPFIGPFEGSTRKNWTRNFECV